MAISREELQVLISANASQFKSELQNINKTLKDFDKNTQKAGSTMGNKLIPSIVTGNLIASAITSTFSLFGSAINSVTDFMGDAVSTTQKYENALIGLQSIAARKIGLQGIEDATQAAKDLASDGLMSVHEAATGLKNLLSTGFSLPESVNLMNAFRDSAAFNRQGMLGFGESISRATEGIKNGNSTLVDNAGITKNLSTILKEAGHSQNELMNATSDATVRQAIYNGILREGNVFQGNAAMLANTTTGQMASLSVQLTNLKIALGGFFKPIQSVLQQGLIAFFSGVNGTLDSASNSIRSFSVKVAGFLLAVIRTIGSLLSKIPVIGKNFQSLATLTLRPSSSVSNLADSTSNYTDAALGAAAATKKLQNQLAGFDEMETLQEPDQSGSVAGPDFSGFGAGLGGITDTFADSAAEINETADELQGKFKEFANVAQFFSPLVFVLNNLDVILKGLGEAWTWLDLMVIQPAVGWWNENVTPVLNQIGSVIQQLVQVVVDNFPRFQAAIQPLTDAVGRFLSGAFQLLGDILGWLWKEILKPIVDFVLANIVPAFEVFINIIIEIAGHISNLLAPVIDSIIPVLKNMWEIFKQVWESIKQIVSQVWTGTLEPIFKSLVDFFVKQIIPRLQDFWSKAQQIFNSLGQLVSDIWGRIHNVISGVVDFISSIPARWQAFKDGEM
jgi:phage-related protein